MAKAAGAGASGKAAPSAGAERDGRAPGAPVVAVPSAGGAAPLRNDIAETEAVAQLLMGKEPDKPLNPGDEAHREPGRKAQDGVKPEDAGEQNERAHAQEPVTEPGEADADDEGGGEPLDEEQDEIHEFYAREVKLTDGSVKTVGELKDFWQQRAQAELAMVERESKLANDHVELERIVKYFDAIPFPVKYRVAEELDAVVRRESAAVMEIFPAWRDEKVRQADEADILSMAREYGREAAIAAELRMPTDRMIVKMLADYARLRRSVQTARERLRQVEPTEKPAARRAAPPNGRDNAKALAARAKQTGRDADETAAVRALFNRR